MKILVTGASGFLGKNLIERLKKLSPRADLITPSRQIMNLTDMKGVGKYIANQKPDIVYHTGALVDLTRSFEIARGCLEANLVGTTNLLQALAKYPPKRFIMASTEEVYGTGALPYREGSEPHPPSPYAVSKLASEHMCRMVAQKAGFPVIIFRIGTMYGPYMPEHRYISQTIRKALNNEDIPLNSGEKKRDYIYVKDVVDAFIAALDGKPAHEYDVINLGGGENMTLRRLVETIVTLTKSASKLRIGEIPDRISEANEWMLDNTKAKKLLDWEPKTGIEEGLTKTIWTQRKKN